MSIINLYHYQSGNLGSILFFFFFWNKDKISSFERSYSWITHRTLVIIAFSEALKIPSDGSLITYIGVNGDLPSLFWILLHFEGGKFLISVANPFSKSTAEADNDSLEVAITNSALISQALHTWSTYGHLWKHLIKFPLHLTSWCLSLLAKTPTWKKMETKSAVLSRGLGLFACWYLCIYATCVLSEATCPDCSSGPVTFGSFFKHRPFFCASNQTFLLK